ncbi:hypothetical protein JCM4814A_48430 [Streptomyces phaeofaciens JCM 4814]|uniref:HEAT repeat domain-containing protein n=1 Tax=Streptomyces phaeofaciens TaxID=68254 RepID=A0A918LPH1_9ACTN|nr:hypothetical protein GCM10010226_05090 [Streptomyces phaeofaciens]
MPVVLVPLNHYSGNLSETIQASVNATGGLDLTVGEADAFVRNTGAVLCFDGLNELGRFRDQGVRQISEFISAVPQVLCVVTCRWNEYSDDFEWDVGWRILPLRRANIEEYLTWHFGAQGAREFQEIAHDGLLDMASNPLLLRMLRDMKPNIPPKKRGLLYSMFTEKMIRMQGVKGARGAQIPYEVRRQVFDFLALDVQRANRIRYSAREMAEVLGEYLTSSHEEYPWRMLLDSCTASGLLVGEGGSYAFLHQSIQEYFAASALEERGLDDIDGEYLLGRSQWNEVLLLLAGITASPSLLIAKLTATDPIMAVKCISHGAVPDRETMDGLVHELRRMAESSSWVTRRTAADLMGELGSPSAHPVLLPLLRDENDEVRWGAVYALKNIGVRGVAAPALIERLDDEFWVTQGEAAETVAALNILDAIPAVVERLASENSYVRSCATHAMTVYCRTSPEGREVVSALLETADSDQRELIRFAMSIAEAGSEVLLRLECALDSKATQVVEAAIRMLILHPGADSAAKIADLVSSPHPSVRETAISAIGKLQAVAFTETVGQALLTDENAQVRGTAATALASMYADESPDFLVRAVEDSSPEVRFAIARGMARLRMRTARPQLRAWAAGDPNARVRVHAIRALGFLGTGDDLEFLAELGSREQDQEIHDSVLEAMENISRGQRRIDF